MIKALRGRGPLVLILLLAALLRLYGLAGVYPVDDEYPQFFVALRAETLGAFLGMIRQNPHHVLLDLWVSYVVGLFSGQAWAFRLPSVLWGVLAVAGVYRLEREQDGQPTEKPALLAALLLSICLLHIDWSRRADFYALLTALSVWQTWAFFKARREGSWRTYGALTLVFLHSHPYAILSLPLHGLWLLPSKFLSGFARCWAVCLAMFMPWFAYSSSTMINRHYLSFEWFPGRFTLGEFLALIPLHLGQAPEVGPHRGWDISSAALLSAVYAAMYLTSLIETLRKRSSDLIGYAHYALWLGTAAVVALDLWYGYFYAHRQLLWLTPFYLLAVAHGAWHWLRAKTSVFALAAVLMFLPAYISVTRFQINMAERFSAILDSIEEHARPGDVLGFHNEAVLMAFLYHFDRSAFSSLGTLRLSRGEVGYDIPPEGALARRGNTEVLAVRIPRGQTHQADGRISPGRLWVFKGSLYDLYVHPPVRFSPPAARGR